SSSSSWRPRSSPDAWCTRWRHGSSGPAPVSSVTMGPGGVAASSSSGPGGPEKGGTSMSISAEAMADQAAIGYNLDAWKDVVIPPGTLLYAGYHGSPAYGKYFTDRETVLAEADGKFGFMLWGALQVKPHATHGDRVEIREFIVSGHVEAAAGAATHNAKAYW